ncbi:hypothetical protein VT84_10010 [Gemmata sp. SH-PL17]|nr:hypothetical protein VT84_10010 [Gemmata sp. SH-PL17]
MSWSKSPSPVTWWSTTAANRSAASDTRYTIHTRSPFRDGAGRSWKNATKSALDSPTSSHPANRVSIVSASDAVTIPVRNTENSTKNRLYPGSRCRYLTANAPIVPHKVNDSSASGTESRSNSNFTAKW